MQQYLAKFRETFLDQSTISSQELLSSLESNLFNDHVNNQLVDKLLEHVSPVNKNLCNVGKDVYSDVEFFTNFSNHNSKTVFDVLHHCHLMGSSKVAKHILSNPTYNVELLQKRTSLLQNMEKTLMDTNMHDTLSKLANTEKDVLWYFEELDPNIQELYNMVFFRFCMFKPMNKYPLALTSYNFYRILVSPFIGLLSPVVYFIIPYIVLSIRFKIRIPFTTYIKLLFETVSSGDYLIMGNGNFKSFRIVSYVFSLVFYFQGIFNSFEISKTLRKITGFIVEKMNRVIQFIQTASILTNTLWNDEFNHVFVDMNDLKTSGEEAAMTEKLDIIDFSLLKNFGKQLHAYITLDKTVLKSILSKVYLIDSLHSFLQFKKNYLSCYCNFSDTTLPNIQVTGLYHPCISHDKVVKNDISLYPKHNIIITGPNAGGKSTFIKSLIIHVLFGQTIGIVNARSSILTPYQNINTQINIPDCKGYESLFEAEMYRCKEKLDILKKSSGLSFFIMDEIFNSTNPVEGIAGAYAIAKNISNYDTCTLVFTTHYLYLTKLEKTGRFVNYRMNIQRDEENNIHYPYLLSKGKSKQYVALELLKKNGFDEDIIHEAVHVKNILTKRKERV